MKILGHRILNSDVRFVFETKDDLISPADAELIKRLNVAVCGPTNWNKTSLSDLVGLLNPLVNSFGEVKVSLEPIDF
jgi:hypothetical protein